jgi:DNA-directed RNA polymerase subunit RPC12/RpoP
MKPLRKRYGHAGKSTVYRNCPCGETAHDFHGGTVSGEPWTKEKHGGTQTYACRNCGRKISVRKKPIDVGHAKAPKATLTKMLCRYRNCRAWFRPVDGKEGDRCSECGKILRKAGARH